LLRLRKYGTQWILTHKSKGTAGRHKPRVEIETEVVEGPKMEAILTALGYRPVFCYEKVSREMEQRQRARCDRRDSDWKFWEIEG
jgi:adenylate cyclase class IV